MYSSLIGENDRHIKVITNDLARDHLSKIFTNSQGRDKWLSMSFIRFSIAHNQIINSSVVSKSNYSVLSKYEVKKDLLSLKLESTEKRHEFFQFKIPDELESTNVITSHLHIPTEYPNIWVCIDPLNAQIAKLDLFRSN